MWFTLITITTVGYGEMVPVTFYGRICCAILIIEGTLVVSVTVMVLTSDLFMSLNQKRVVMLVNRLELREAEAECAVNIIGSHWRRNKLEAQLKRSIFNKS